MSSEPIAIRIERVTKRYRTGRSRTLRDGLAAVWDRFRGRDQEVYSAARGRIDPTIFALRDVTFDVAEGTGLGIIGPNGAGKTTMMDVMTGKTRPDSGSARFGDEYDLLTMSEPEIAEAGIGRKFQKPTVFEKLTVFENLELSLWGDKSFWRTLVATLKPSQRDHIDDILGVIGLSHERRLLAGSLSHGQKQWLEIGMLLMQEPELLLVDEPVAGMTPQETERTAELLRSLKAEHTLVVVEHDMEFVRGLNAKVSVLHEGHILCEGSMDHVQNDPRVVEVYLGRDSAKGHA